MHATAHRLIRDSAPCVPIDDKTIKAAERAQREDIESTIMVNFVHWNRKKKQSVGKQDRKGNNKKKQRFSLRQSFQVP